MEGFTRWYRLLLSRGDENEDGENGLRMERRRGWVGVNGAAGIVIEFEIYVLYLCIVYETFIKIERCFLNF